MVKDIVDWEEKLMEACWNGDLEGVIEATRNGADPTTRTWLGDDPVLRVTVKSPQEEKIKKEILIVLLAKGAYVDAKNEKKETALMGSAENLEVEVTQLLLDFGANANLQDIYGETAAMKAVNSPFLWKYSKNLPRIIEELKKHGANMDIKNNKGQTVLDLIKEKEEEFSNEPEVLQNLRKAREIIEGKTTEEKTFVKIREGKGVRVPIK
jgi:ankyrin repeat protein